MKRFVLAAVLVLFATTALAQPAWEVRRVGGKCRVEASAKKAPGSAVAGPFKTKKRAEQELKKLEKGPKCR